MAGYIGTKAVLLSTTAASVTGNADIGGDLTVDTSTLFVDSTNNRVGVGTSSPSYDLYVKQGGDTYSFGLEADGDDSRLVIGEIGSTWRFAATYNTNGSFMPLTFFTGDTERMRIDASGYLLVGTQFPVGNGKIGLDFGSSGDGIAIDNSSTTDRSPITFYNANGFVGRISTNGSSTAYLTSSDYRLKEDVQPMVGASDRVLALNPVNFAWKVDGSRVDGFLAHEAQAVVPEAVTGAKDAVDADGNPVYQGIDQSKLVPLLTAALQEALNEIAALKDRVAALETV